MVGRPSPGPERRRPSRGYTLLELMIVITVLGIMMSLAIPGFSYLAANTKMKSASSDLHLALLKARSEAVKRNGNVTITPNNTGDWALGWTITTAGGDTLQQQGAMGGVAIIPDPNPQAALTFQRTGRILNNASPDFNIQQKTRNVTQESDVDVQRCVSLAANGAPYLKDSAC